MNRKSVIVFSILAAAFFCRAYFVVNFPITLDEAWSNTVGHLPPGGVIREAKADVSPPLTLLLHKFFTVAQTGAGIRWIFALFGFLSIFYLTKFINAGVPVLLLAGFSAFLIFEGSIARMHAFSIFFSSAACYYYVRTFEREKRSDFALLVLFCVLALYNFYPFGALVVAFIAVYLVLRKNSVSKPAFYAYAFFSIILFSLPLLYIFNPSYAGSFASEKLFELPSGAILAYLPYALAYSESLLKFSEIRGIKLGYFLVLFSVIAPVLVKGAGNRRGDLRLRLSLWLAAVSLGLVFAVSLKIPKVLYSAKYVAWAYPLFAYIFIMGLESLPGKIRGLVLSVILAVNFASLYSVLNFNPENWREVAAFVGRSAEEKDIILFDGSQMSYPFSFYYSGRGKIAGLPSKAPLFVPEEYMAYNRVWLVLSHNWARSGVYRGLLAKKIKLTEDHKFGDIQIVLFEQSGRKSFPAAAGKIRETAGTY